MLTKNARKYLHGGLIALLIFVTTSLLYSQNLLQTLEWTADDFRTQLIRSDAKADDDIVVLLIDEASLAAMDPIVGRWPWPRSVWADVLEFMQMGQAQSVAFDILFTERDLDADKQQSIHDQAFIDMAESTGIATQAIQLLRDDTNPYANQTLPEFYGQKFSVPVKGGQATLNNTFYLPYKGLAKASKQVGVVEFSPDKDGLYRRTNLFRDYAGQFFPVLSIAPLLTALNITKVTLDEAKHEIQLGNLRVPLDKNGFYQVNFYEHFQSYSIASVLASIAQLRQGNLQALYTDPRYVSPEVFAGKTVFIGTSAVGLEDMKNTPLESRWPGVFLHASIASNLLLKDFIYPINPHWVYVSLFLSILLTSLSVLLFQNFILQTLSPVLLSAGYILFSVWLQVQWSIQLDIAPIILGMLASWLLLSAFLAATEGTEKRRVRNMLSQYVSPAALNSVLDNYEGQAEAGHGKEEEMTVVFSDIRSFTTISESLEPKQVVKLLNIHLDAMTQATFDHNGTMDKFIGDATMAFWGAPLPDKDHALNATRAMFQMHKAMSQVNATLKQEGMPPIAIGIGGNTGQVILGNIGSSQKLDYTVIGDAVNLGSRLEGLTKQYGVPLLISEFTYEKIKQQIPCAPIDLVRVKGKLKPIKIYLPLADIQARNRDEMFKLAEQCNAGFEAYHQKEFQTALGFFNQLPEDPFATFKTLYQHRCQAFQDAPPPEDWDGVFTSTSK